MNTKPFTVIFECSDNNGYKTKITRYFCNEDAYQDCVADLATEFDKVRQIYDSREA